MPLNTSQIYLNLDTNKPNVKIDERFLQGNTDKTLNIKFLKNNEAVTITDGVKATITLVFYNGSTVYKKYVIKPTLDSGGNNTNYTIPPIANNMLTIPFTSDIAFVDHAGRTDLIIKIDDSGSYYTYSCTYNVDANEAYNPVGIIDNLPSIDGIKADVTRLNSDMTTAKADIATNTQSITTKANKDLSNVDGLSSAPEGSLLYKKNGVLKGTPLIIDDVDKLIVSPYSLKVPPNTIDLGENISLKENGGFINFYTKASGKYYVALDYENDAATGSKKPIYYERGPLQTKVELQNVDTTTMNNVTTINLGTATSDVQVQAIYLKFVNSVNNLKAKLTINSKDVAYYPSKAAWDGTENGFNMVSGLQKIPLSPFWSTITGFNRTITLKADAPINLLGNGTLPYIAEDLNSITKKDVALMEDIPTTNAETGASIRDKLQNLTGNDRLSATAIKNLPASLQVATQEGDTTYTPTKLLFPFANGLVNDNGIVTVNTSFVVTDENNEIVPDCSVLEVPSTSLISVSQNQGNSNAATLDFKGINVDSGDTTPVVPSKNISFPQATVVNTGGKTVVNTAPLVSVDGTLLNERVEIFEFPSTGGLGVEEVAGTDTVKITSKGIKATSNGSPIMDSFKNIDFPDNGLLIGEEDPADSNKLLVSFAGIPTKKNSGGTVRKATELAFPQAHVFGQDGGTVTVGTGHLVSQGDNELSSTVTTWTFPDDSGLSAELNPNDSNNVIVRNTVTDNGISITNDDSQPVNQIKYAYFPQARIEDGSVTESKVIKTAIPVKNGNDDYDDYKKINFENNDFIIERDANDNDQLNIKGNGFSVETDNVETANIKLLDFNKDSFTLDVGTEGVAKITTKNKANNGFLAVFNHKQVIASANAQEIYRTTTLKPNHIVWQDDYVEYDQTTGLIKLKYSGSNGEKQLFKLIARATVRRQVREADLGAFLYFIDNSTGQYIQDVNGETPIVNKTIKKELASDFIEIATIISITQDTTLRTIFKDDTPNKFVDVLDLAMGTSAIMVEKVNANNQPSSALTNFEILAQESTRFIKHDFGSNFETAAALINNTPVGDKDMSDDMVIQQDGWILYYQDAGTYKINTTPDGTSNCFEMVDKLAGFGYFNIARILDYEDTWCLRGKEVTARLDRVEQTGDFKIVPVVWRRKMNEYPMKIVTGMNNNGEYSTTDGWEVIEASKVDIAAPTPAETTASFTCTYTVPDDAVNLGFMLMASKQQTRSIIKFTDFAIGCDPAFERWIIRYPEQAYEGQLKYDSKYVKFVQYNTTPYDMSQWYQIPNGTPGDNNYAPLYTGEVQSGGNADITRIYDSTSTDFETLHNKGKFRFGKDGRVTVHYKIPIATDKFADGSDHNTFRIGFVKDTGGGNILNGTPITASLRDINIPKAGNVFNDDVRTNGYANVTFTMDVKENDEYWIAVNPISVPRDSGNEGHIYSYPSGSIEFTFLEDEYKINLLQAQLDSLIRSFRTTSDAITNKAYVELGWDTGNNKPLLEAKVDTTTP